MPPRVDPELIRKERDELKKVVLKTFGASPRTVTTYGKTTLTWDVTVPTSTFDIEIFLDDEEVEPQGTKVVALTSSRTFSLAARTEHAGRPLRRVSVTVDASECRTETLLDPFLITSTIKSKFDDRFSANSDFSLRDQISVTLGDGTISISVPLEIEVPHWFNADMDIGIKLAVSPGRPVLVTAPTVTVDVSWSFFEHLASLGCTGAVQSGMEKLAQAFMADIVQSDVVPAVAGPLTEQVTKFLAGLGASDPQHRTYAARVVHLGPEGFTVTACPTPPQ